MTLISRRFSDGVTPLARSSTPRQALMLTATAMLACAASAQEAFVDIRVDITPPDAVAAGAGWKFAQELLWHGPGDFATNLPVGVYPVEFKSVPNWTITPLTTVVAVQPGSNWIVLPRTYQAVPVCPIELTATEGGFVDSQAWMPFGPYGARSPLSALGQESARWESSAFNPQTGYSHMPRENQGYRVQLRAMAYPGHTFVGWSGDVVGPKNPLTLIMNRPRKVKAHFTETVGLSASQAAEGYQSPGSFVVHGQFNYPAGQQLRALRWRPHLPVGWSPVAVSGLGGPQLRAGEIVFDGPLGHNPLQFNVTIDVPAGEVGLRTLGGEVTYSFLGEPDWVTRPVTALASAPALAIGPRRSPTANLAILASAGGFELKLTGEVGQTYTIEQLPQITHAPMFQPVWWFLTDLTLTNETQSFPLADSIAPAGVPSSFYRAIRVE